LQRNEGRAAIGSNSNGFRLNVLSQGGGDPGFTRNANAAIAQLGRRLFQALKLMVCTLAWTGAAGVADR